MKRSMSAGFAMGNQWRHRRSSDGSYRVVAPVQGKRPEGLGAWLSQGAAARRGTTGGSLGWLRVKCSGW